MLPRRNLMNERIYPIVILLMLAAAAFADNCLAAHLSLDHYLSDVRKNQLGYRASLLNAEGSFDRSRNGDLQVSPTFFAGAQYMNDAKVQPFFPYKKLINDTYQVGVSQATS